MKVTHLHGTKNYLFRYLKMEVLNITDMKVILGSTSAIMFFEIADSARADKQKEKRHQFCLNIRVL